MQLTPLMLNNCCWSDTQCSASYIISTRYLAILLLCNMIMIMIMIIDYFYYYYCYYDYDYDYDYDYYYNILYSAGTEMRDK